MPVGYGRQIFGCASSGSDAWITHTQVVDCKHYRTNHEQSQYEGQLYINGHALYSLGPVVGAFYAAKSAMPSILEG